MRRARTSIVIGVAVTFLLLFFVLGVGIGGGGSGSGDRIHDSPSSAPLPPLHGSTSVTIMSP
jgi:hypothetical protein